MPMHVLFVDDEPQVLAGLQRTMFMAGRDWDMTFSPSGAEALLELERSPVDVVVTDMRMPMMDGAALLAQVRARSPRTIRIILSGHTEREAALRSLDVAHQFLSKPCPSENLLETIDRAVALRHLMSEPSLQAAVGAVTALPSPPHLLGRLQHLLGSEANLHQIGQLVSEDPALAAKVLQLANSAFFGSGTPMLLIDDAVARLGTTMLRTVMLATEIFHGDPGGQADLLRVPAVRASRLALSICASRGCEQDVSTAALLARVGLLLESSEPRDLRDEDEFPSYAELGAYLLGLWGLPVPIIEAVANHRAPGRVIHQRFDTVGIVHVAVALANGEEPDVDYLRRMGVDAQLPQWRELAQCAIGEEGASE